MTDSTSLAKFRATKTTLGNGIDVIVRHQPNLPIVAINLWYHVGSKNEERHQRGYAHLFEHLMFEGSAHFPGDFFKHLQPLGANINGSTSSDRTNYFVDLPTAHAERAIAMESDRMAHLLEAMDLSKLDIQKNVVKNEYRQNYANRPYGMVWPVIAEALYPPHHPYSWMTIGVMEDLDRASLEDVSAFFRRYYVPSNASVAIVGDLQEDAALSLAERYFGPIPGGSGARRPWVPEQSFSTTHEIVLHDRVELDRLYLVWPSVPHFHPDDAPLLILGDLLARGRSSRLHRKLVIEEQVAQDVTAYQSGRELAGSFGVIVTLRPSRSIDQVRKLIDSELASIAGGEISDEEFSKVQRMRVASFLFALEHVGGFGGIADRLNAYNVFRGDPLLITSDIERFDRVDTTQVREVAARYLNGRPRVSLSVVGRKPTHSVSALDRSVLPEIARASAYRPPLPEIIKLSCGIPLWVFPRNDLPTVAGSIIITAGASYQTPGQAGLAQMTTVMLDEGTTSRSADEIALAIESMGAAVDASCGWDGSYVSFRCLQSSLAPILDLTTDILLNPAFPDSEWKRVRGQAIAALKAERDSAESRAYRCLLSSIYSAKHPFHFPLAGTEETVTALAPGDLARFHSQYLLPSIATIVVAGDVDPADLARQFNDRLPSVPAGKSTGLAPLPPFLEARRRLILLDRPGAAQAVVRVGHLGVTRSEPGFEHILILNQILGGQFSSRLNAKLREERGFTYGARSHFDCRRQPGPFSITSSIQVDRLAAALTDLRDEVIAITDDKPPTQAELDSARRALIEGHARHFETPSALVNRCANLVIHDLPVEHEAGFADRLLSIDLKTLSAEARRHINPEALIFIVVADADVVADGLEQLDWAPLEIIEG